MTIKSTDLIAGFPAVRIRDMLRQFNHDSSWGLQSLQQALFIDEHQATDLVLGLERLGQVERIPDGTYRNTHAGQRLANARASAPLRRKAADRIFREFMERVERVNSDGYFLCGVEKVVLFGSYLDPAQERLGDVDVAVKIAQKEKDHAKYEALNNARVDQLWRGGRRIATICAQVDCGRDEVKRFLKSRSRGLALITYDTHENWFHDKPHRVVFPSGDANGS